MKIELTEQQFRYLLDLVYIGNWVINSTRENDRIQEYDQVESLVFSHCLHHKMSKLVELYRGELIPCENNMEGNVRHKQAGKEIEQLLKDLRNNLSEEDMALVDQMLEQTLIVCDTECSDAFQYGFSAGLLLMQEVQEILRKRVDTAAHGIF